MRRRFLNNTYKNISGDDIFIEYFTIEALEDGLTANLSINACEYCIDNGEWNTLAKATNTESINTGQTLSFRGNLTPTSINGIGTFTISKKCNVKGNVMSLLYGDDLIDKTDLTGKKYAFYKLFYNCSKIVDASELILPATTLATYCYQYMFCGCTSLTTAPELPATTLVNDCYEYMFEDCKGLTTAPELPATTLATYCYYSMFEGCTGLTVAPELPATTLATGCYGYMFYGANVLPDCSNIDFTKHNNGGLQGLFAGTKVTDNDLYNILPINPDTGKYWLPSTTLASRCYSSMFQGCTGLTVAPELPATTLANSCYYSMFAYCTSLTTAPELPATTLAEYCYEYMFNGCTGLTTAPELPATNLEESCYFEMFSGCKKLNYIKMLATDISTPSCLYNWVYNISSTGTFVKHPDMTSLPTSVSGIPSGWTVVDNVESNLITFTVIDKDYQAEEGMTWNQWLNSEYNTINAYEDNYGHYIEASAFLGEYVDGIYIISYQDGTPVLLDDIIINNHNYTYIPPTPSTD